MERSLDFVILLDIYGELLANSQREALDMRYNADRRRNGRSYKAERGFRDKKGRAAPGGAGAEAWLRGKAQNSFGGAGPGVRPCFLNEAGKQRPAP